MKINLKLLKKEIEEVANKHEQIDSFFWGDFVRFYEEKNVKHRTLIATFVRVPTASRTRTTINLLLTIADRSYRNNRDLDDIQSDAVEILNDIITIINRAKRWREFLTEEISPSIDVFQERGGDMVAGAFASINFNINNLSDICAIPISDYDFNESFKSICEPSIFLINGIEVAEVMSGSRKEIKVLNLDNEEVGSFNGTSWVVQPSFCADANYRLINTNNQELETGSIESGESKDITAPDAEVTVNGSNDFPDIPSGGSENILVENTQGTSVGAFDNNTNSWVIPDANYTVLDQDGNNYGSGSIPSGGSENILINVSTQSGRFPFKTGQTVEYRTGDDGTYQSGEPFFTIPFLNPFGNNLRFTDLAGGTAYADDIVIDWSTLNNGKVLGYSRSNNGGNINWADAIDYCLALNLGGYATGWRLPQINEMLSLMYFHLGNPLNYSDLNLGGVSYAYWTSTTSSSNTNNAIEIINATTTICIQRVKTTSSARRCIAVREFTVNGTILT